MNKAANIIEENKGQILDEWVKEVRHELSAPNATVDPVLRDHVPLLLDDIIKIMRQYEAFNLQAEIKNFDGMLDNSIGHGRHRSSTSGYDMAQVLKEYIILHKILTRLLRSKDSFSTEVADTLKFIIEESMIFAAVAFQSSLQEMRQKLMSVLVHDVRNPISAANLAAGMLDRNHQPELFDKVKKMLQTSLKRALKLMEGFLESTNISAGEGLTLHFAEKDLLQYIKSVHSEASAIYSNKVVLESPDAPILGVFDTAMIRRVLENIVNNAVKYGDRGKPISIKVATEANDVIISVHNHGNPIPKEKQEQIFEFRNTSGGSGPSNLKSWGMGLTLVNTVAEAHGGFLKLNSSKENGTTFTVLLKKNANTPGKVKTRISFGQRKDHHESLSS